MKQFIYNNEIYYLHFDADEHGVYGIRKDTEDTITFLNQLSKRYNKEYKQAYNFAVKNNLHKP